MTEYKNNKEEEGQRRKEKGITDKITLFHPKSKSGGKLFGPRRFRG